MREYEQFAWDTFIRILPNFAEEQVSCAPGANPPDVLCHAASSRRIGVELVGWIDEEQIGVEVRAERRREAFERIAQAAATWIPQHIGFASLHPISDEPEIPAAEVATFQTELARALHAADEHWDAEWDSPPGGLIYDLAAYPTLARYVNSIAVRSNRGSPPIAGVPWILLPARGGAFTPATMLDALRQQIARKCGRYTNPTVSWRVDAAYLLVHYDDRAYRYNTPAEVPGFGLQEIADQIRHFLHTIRNPFERIFLVDTMPGRQRAIRLWP